MFQDWFVELVSVLSDIFIGITAIIVAFAAVKGLSTWSSELKGKARLEIGRRLTLLAYTFRDQYMSARGMFTFPQESADREKIENETRTETQYRNEYFARMTRTRLLQNTMRELYQAAWEAEIVFDKDIKDLIKPLAKSLNELYIAIDTYFSRYIERASHDGAPDAADMAWLEEYHKTIYMGMRRMNERNM